MTSQEAWSGVKPSVEHFRVWGSTSHVHNSDEKSGKLDDKSWTGVMFGFSEESKGYMLYNPKTNKILMPHGRRVMLKRVLEETQVMNQMI